MQFMPGSSVYDLDERELMILRQELEHRKKSVATAWILWVFLGWAGGHRFYMNRIGSGVLMLLFCWLTLGIWWIVDAFLISRMLKQNERDVQNEIMLELQVTRKRRGGTPGQGLICAKCGTPITFGVKFCANCGTTLDWPAYSPQQIQTSGAGYQQQQAQAHNEQYGYASMTPKSKGMSPWLIGLAVLLFALIVIVIVAVAQMA